MYILYSKRTTLAQQFKALIVKEYKQKKDTLNKKSFWQIMF